jgi:predicted enzyme related to lactoylglutathione lyase
LYSVTNGELEKENQTPRKKRMTQQNRDANINVIVLRVDDIQTSVELYSKAFNLTFKQEKHGNGPIHYSTE